MTNGCHKEKPSKKAAEAKKSPKVKRSLKARKIVPKSLRS